MKIGKVVRIIHNVPAPIRVPSWPRPTPKPERFPLKLPDKKEKVPAR